MAKKKTELFINVDNDKEFEHILNNYCDCLICAHVYCSYFGFCTALDNLFVKIKLDWSNGQMILLRVLADEVESLKRFRWHSDPIFLFIMNKKVTNTFRGVNNVRFAEMARMELSYFENLQKGIAPDRRTYEIDEATTEEIEWQNVRKAEKEQEESYKSAQRAARQAARKRHRAELMVPHLRHLNFVLYWPHCTHAHPDLYERWDLNGIIMVGREEIQLTKELAEDILYAGDAPLNEASMHKLLSAPALAICFRILDTDKHFVPLVRKILYEEIPPLDNSLPSAEQPVQKTAFDQYKSYSPSREEVWQTRREEMQRRKEERVEQRARRLSEMQRLARQAIADAIEARKAEKEQQKLKLLKAGNLSALKELQESSDDIQVDIDIPEKLSDDEVEESSEEEDKNEYFPPHGLLIPGFYAPPNDVAKVNGLAILFPKLVMEHVTPEPEYLPPHVLVLLEMAKTHKAIEALAKYKSAVIHMGIFKATTPYDAEHVAYSVKQFDSLNTKTDLNEMRLAFMLSVKVDLPLLALMDLSPCYVSRDTAAGEEECAAMFPVDYGDACDEFEDFHCTDINKE